MKNILLATVFMFAAVAMAQTGESTTEAKAPTAKHAVHHHRMVKKEKKNMKKKAHKKWKHHKKAKKETTK